MRWGSFIFGLLLLLLGLFGGILLLFLGIPALILLIYGLTESPTEKVQREQLEEIKHLREEVKELKKADNAK